MTGPGYPYYLGDSWATGYRSQRIARPAAAHGPRLSVADMSRHPARHPQRRSRRRFVPYLLRDLHALARTSPAASGCCRAGTTSRARTRAAAAYYNAVWRNTLALTFHDELPGVGLARRRRPLVRGDAPAARRARQPLVGRRRPPTASSRPATTSSREAMADARDELVRRQARRAVDWTWGHQHQLDLQNQTLGAVRRRRRSAGCSTAAATRSAAAARSSTPPRWDAARRRATT